MTYRARRRFLLAISLALTGGIVLAVVMALVPVENDASSAGKAATQPAEASLQGQSAKPLSAYSVIYARDLRKSLYDPEPVKVVATKAVEPSLPVQLTGTVIDPSAAFGLFQTKGGQSRFVSVGEVIEGAELIAIGEGTATLSFRGRQITLKVQKTEKAEGPQTREAME